MNDVKEGIIMRAQPTETQKFDFVKYVACDMCIGVKESKDPALRKIRVTKNTRRLTVDQT